jgi:hypothetical protein
LVAHFVNCLALYINKLIGGNGNKNRHGFSYPHELFMTKTSDLKKDKKR